MGLLVLRVSALRAGAIGQQGVAGIWLVRAAAGPERRGLRFDLAERGIVAGRFRNRPLVLTGFILISLSTYLLFALIYLSFLWYNWKHANCGSTFVEEQKKT